MATGSLKRRWQVTGGPHGYLLQYQPCTFPLVARPWIRSCLVGTECGRGRLLSGSSYGFTCPSSPRILRMQLQSHIGGMIWPPVLKEGPRLLPAPLGTFGRNEIDVCLSTKAYRKRHSCISSSKTPSSSLSARWLSDAENSPEPEPDWPIVSSSFWVWDTLVPAFVMWLVFFFLLLNIFRQFNCQFLKKKLLQWGRCWWLSMAKSELLACFRRSDDDDACAASAMLLLVYLKQSAGMRYLQPKVKTPTSSIRTGQLL